MKTAELRQIHQTNAKKLVFLHLKFFAAILLLVSILISFSSCVWIPRYTKYHIDNDSLTSVDIYDLRKSTTNDSRFLKLETPVYTLTEEQIPDFVEDLESLWFDDSIFLVLAAMDPSFHYGDWVVRLNYNNGSYTLISSGGYGETYNAAGEVIDSNHYSYDDEKWEKFVLRYLPEEIYNEKTEHN